MPPTPGYSRTDTLLPYTTLFRSRPRYGLAEDLGPDHVGGAEEHRQQDADPADAQHGEGQLLEDPGDHLHGLNRPFKSVARPSPWGRAGELVRAPLLADRKSTRLNSSH